MNDQHVPNECQGWLKAGCLYVLYGEIPAVSLVLMLRRFPVGLALTAFVNIPSAAGFDSRITVG